MNAREGDAQLSPIAKQFRRPAFAQQHLQRPRHKHRYQNQERDPAGGPQREIQAGKAIAVQHVHACRDEGG